MSNTGFKPIKMIGEKKGLLYYLRVIMYKISSVFELLIVLLIYLAIFSDKLGIAGFTREEIITYIIAGNLIGLIGRYFLYRIIKHDLNLSDSKLIIYKPIKYFFHILVKGFGSNFLPFVMAVALHFLVLYFFFNSFILNLEAAYIAVITVMVILAFITEFLMVYIANLFIFWKFESRELFKIIERFKKILAGNYFPLSLLPPVFISVSLILPFAYSFFIPIELYLKKIDLVFGLKSMVIQILWIILLYISIKLIWQAKSRKEKKVKVVKTFK